MASIEISQMEYCSALDLIMGVWVYVTCKCGIMCGEGGGRAREGEELIDSKQGFIILHPVTYQDCSTIRIVCLQTCLPLRTIFYDL